jgi:ribosomal protein S20
MSNVNALNSYYTNAYLDKNLKDKSSQSKSTSADAILKNYTNSNSNSSSNDFLASRIDAFTKQADQYAALAKSKLTSKSVISSDLQNLFKAINSGDSSKVQNTFDTLMSHLDDKKLNSKTQSLLDKFDQLIETKNFKNLKNTFYDISHNSNSLANAYVSTTKTPTTQPSSAAKVLIATDLKNLEKAVISGKESEVTKAFKALDKHIDESKLNSTTKTLLNNFENAIDDKDVKKLKGYLTDLQKSSVALAGAIQDTTSINNQTKTTQQKMLESLAKSSYSSFA